MNPLREPFRRSALCALVLALAACDSGTGPDPVDGVVIQPAGETLFPGDTMTFFALDDGGNRLSGAQWSSTAPAVATVDAGSGRVTAVANGSTQIRGTVQGTSAEAGVTVQADPFAECGVTLMLATASQAGALAEGDCTFSDLSRVDFYEFRLREARTVTITLTSTQFDAYLVLAARTGIAVFGEDDDSGGGSNARIVLVLQPGRYLIAANSFGPGEAGAYTLAVSAA
ncbi:MAG TPA: Ig-like domain-containing protein [Longimicrobiaceae bacterium]|nr:Ig-like domain-containing protein [Longimicrobiaceae bacterium]